MPVTVEILQPPTILKQYDVLIQPDPGGRREPGSYLDRTITIVRPPDRILPTTEPQEPVKSQVSTIFFNADHTQHLEKVADTQKVFDEALGVKNERRILSYNPVFDRVNIELATTPEQRVAVRKNIEVENEKNLRERYHTAVSVVKYILDEDGNAYGENSSEPADLVFERGALQRIRLGSPESRRELSTIEGGIKAKKKLADPATPLHSKMVVISGPGVVKGTVYTDNLVDIYESDLDLVTAKKIIIMTRFASSLGYDEYKRKACYFKHDYFNEADGPVDAYFLSNPIFIDSEIDPRSSHEIFIEEFEYQKEVIREKDFQEILKVCLPFILNYIDVLCSEAFDPHEIATAFNAILNKGDAIRREIARRGQSIINGFRDFGSRVIDTFRNIKEEALWWGRQVVENIQAGCGLSGGFSLGGTIRGMTRGIGGLISSIVGRFFGGSSESDQYGSLVFDCPHPDCGKKNRRPYGQLIPNCQHCGKDVRC